MWCCEVTTCRETEKRRWRVDRRWVISCLDVHHIPSCRCACVFVLTLYLCMWPLRTQTVNFLCVIERVPHVPSHWGRNVMLLCIQASFHGHLSTYIPGLGQYLQMPFMVCLTAQIQVTSVYVCISVVWWLSAGLERTDALNCDHVGFQLGWNKHGTIFTNTVQPFRCTTPLNIPGGVLRRHACIWSTCPRTAPFTVQHHCNSTMQRACVCWLGHEWRNAM